MARTRSQPDGSSAVEASDDRSTQREIPLTAESRDTVPPAAIAPEGVPEPPGRESRPIVAPARDQEFFIPIHGEIRLRTAEVAVVNHPAFQRLGEIYQLGQTYLVYRGATHKRLEHALGAMHVAQMMISSIARNSGGALAAPRDREGAWNLASALTPVEEEFIRLGALLHDIGHLPAGHTLEDEVGLLPPHDGAERLSLVFDRRDWHGAACPATLRELVDSRYAAAGAKAGLRTANGKSLTPTEIVFLLIEKGAQSAQQDRVGEFRVRVCRDLIGNTICADLLDYLHRDWLHLGKRREFDTRLLGYMEIRTRVGSPEDSRLVINLRGGHRVRTDAVTLILDLLESRYQLAEIALFHRTKCCAAAMLERVVAELGAAQPDREKFTKGLPERLLESSDSEMLVLFDQLLAQALQAKKGGDADAERLAGAQRLVRKLRQRELHKEFLAYPEFKLADVALEVQNLYAGPESISDPIERARQGAKNRLDAVRMLEAEFKMEAGSLVMYCPPRKMQTKIAEVQVLVHGDVHALDDYETTSRDRGVTGGHLAAQKERFRRLWRIVFALEAVERSRLQKLELMAPLEQAIDLCVLRRRPQATTLEAAIHDLASALTRREGSALHRKAVKRRDAIAARESTSTFYPGGAPSLLSLVD